MRQEAPDPEILETLVSKLKYKPGWSFDLEDLDRGQGSAGLTLSIHIREPDSYNPTQWINVVHYMLVPPAAFNEASWRRWLLEQILLVERHEACEFFQMGSERPYAPNHAPGNDPYIIFDQGTREGAETDYKGRPFDPTQRSEASAK